MSLEVVMERCRICSCAEFAARLDFGPQALRNRFLRAAEEVEFTHPLALACCSECGTVQLTDPPPVAELRPRFDWIRYNEPERHLDRLVDDLVLLPGITPQSVIAGLTYKDDSTLERLRRRGFARSWRPELRDDLSIPEPNSGIESVQARLTVRGAEELAAKHSRPDLLVVRHVLEHAQLPVAALAWARSLVHPGGYVVFEVPDASRAFDRLDYTTVWEEHVLYFTAGTLRTGLERASFEVVALVTYPYTLEDSLLAIARPSVASPIVGSPQDTSGARRFLTEYPRVRERIRRQLQPFRRIAMLGAGHMTGAFLNLYGLAGRVEFVVDDHPGKQGLLMPGSRLAIRPSSDLVDAEIDLCLMTVRPEIEEAVRDKNAAFLARGGLMASVFPASPYSFDRVCAGVAV